jgi:outer membrane autotransporter protein
MTQYGLGANATSDGNAHDFNYNIYGMAVGTDYNITDDFLIGTALGYSYFNVATQGVDGHLNSNNIDFALYAREYYGDFWLLGIGAAALSENNGTRNIDLATTQTANSRSTGAQAATYWEAGYSWNTSSGFVVQPLTGIQYINVYRQGFVENGAGVLDLNVAQTGVGSLRTVIGTRVLRPFVSRSGSVWAPEVRGMWIHEYLSQNRLVTSTLAGVSGFQIAPQGLALGADFALLGTGINVNISSRASVGLHYDAYFSANQFAQAGFGQFLMRW